MKNSKNKNKKPNVTFDHKKTKEGPKSRESQSDSEHLHGKFKKLNLIDKEN